jgi:hypothetical protein
VARQWERPRDRIRAQHFAFEVELHELPALVSRFEEQGIEFRDFFQHRTTTPTVFGFIRRHRSTLTIPLATCWNYWRPSRVRHART